MKIEEMRRGGLYRLKETVENEHQDHLFTYPAGLIVRLEYVSEEADYDGRGTTKVKVCHFDIPTCGMFYVFDPDNLEPATEKDLAASKLVASYEPLGH